jgi:hypothetical protein
MLAQHDRLLRSAAEVAPTPDKTQRIVRLNSDDGRVFVWHRQSKHYSFFSLVLVLLLL